MWREGLATTTKGTGQMKALEWLAGHVLGLLTPVAFVLAGVGVGVGIFEHDWVLVGLGVGFAGVAWLLSRLDEIGGE